MFKTLILLFIIAFGVVFLFNILKDMYIKWKDKKDSKSEKETDKE